MILFFLRMTAPVTSTYSNLYHCFAIESTSPPELTTVISYLQMKNISFGYIAKKTIEYQNRASAPVIPQTEMLFHRLVGAGYKV